MLNRAMETCSPVARSMSSSRSGGKTQVSKSTSAGKSSSKAVGRLVDEISKLSVLELSELVSALQEKLGVTAQMAPSAPAGQAATAPGATEAPAQGAAG